MNSPDASDWNLALRLAAEPLPAPMTTAHLRRARMMGVGYLLFATLSSLLVVLMPVASLALRFSVLVLSILLAITVIGAGISGSLAEWSAPLRVLSAPDATTVRNALLLGAEIPEGTAGDLIWLLTHRFLFGSWARLLLNIEIGLIFCMLAASVWASPAFAAAFCVGAVMNFALVILELRRRRSAARAGRVTGPNHQG